MHTARIAPSPPRLLGVVLLLLALHVSGCGRGDTDARTATRTHFFHVDGMVQSEGIT